MALKKLFRDRWDKKIAGVFGGLGSYFNVDPNILRLVAVSLILPTGIIILPVIYLVLAFIIPKGPNVYIQPLCKKLYRTKQDALFLGVCSGIAQFLKVNVGLVRIAFLALLFITGFFPLLIAYIAAGSILPLIP
jgi:phage shock protein C